MSQQIDLVPENDLQANESFQGEVSRDLKLPLNALPFKQFDLPEFEDGFECLEFGVVGPLHPAITRLAHSDVLKCEINSSKTIFGPQRPSPVV